MTAITETLSTCETTDEFAPMVDRTLNHAATQAARRHKVMANIRWLTAEMRWRQVLKVL